LMDVVAGADEGNPLRLFGIFCGRRKGRHCERIRGLRRWG
jgi:hypothetical protein